MGAAKCRGSLTDRIQQAQRRPKDLAQDPHVHRNVITVRPCLMRAIGACAVSFRVRDDAPVEFMCAQHWRWVPDDVRDRLRKAQLLKPSDAPEHKLARRQAVEAAVRAVHAALSAPPAHHKASAVAGDAR